MNHSEFVHICYLKYLALDSVLYKVSSNTEYKHNRTFNAHVFCN